MKVQSVLLVLAATLALSMAAVGFRRQVKDEFLKDSELLQKIVDIEKYKDIIMFNYEALSTKPNLNAKEEQLIQESDELEQMLFEDYRAYENMLKSNELTPTEIFSFAKTSIEERYPLIKRLSAKFSDNS
ncbi:hypothetical protein Ciccas_010325 [Cichlidogyrus casuarinus]|uniref:Uncharacterized protein n=1 Tax=Cichlidogyrus casuarinus TaxID=1844966 RepID=A0ABD2PVJ4_9PLAT